MSTSPEDRIVNVLSRWLAGHLDNRELRSEIEAAGRDQLGPPQAEAVGDSVAIDGACLTVVDAHDGRLAFDVVPETVARVKPFGAEVNVEPAVRAGEPLGGHYVQGHVDGVGRVRSIESEGA